MFKINFTKVQAQSLTQPGIEFLVLINFMLLAGIKHVNHGIGNLFHNHSL